MWKLLSYPMTRPRAARSVCLTSATVLLALGVELLLRLVTDRGLGAWSRASSAGAIVVLAAVDLFACAFLADEFGDYVAGSRSRPELRDIWLREWKRGRLLVALFWLTPLLLAAAVLVLVGWP